jgi:chloramphenicol-sensitive protein RarD
MFPAFFPLLKPAGAAEVLAHRIVWTFALMLGVLVVMRRLATVRLLNGRSWLLLGCASMLISANWVIYVYAVNNGNVVDAALGYFINPLISVVLGVLLFGERLNHPQLAALLVAVVAVVVLSVNAGGLPLISLGLAASFGLYGAVKKAIAVDPLTSVGIEAAIGVPVALAFIVTAQIRGTGHFTNLGLGHAMLMILAGVVTAVPLMFFAAAAHRLPLVTLGLLMYLTPAMQMTWGVTVAHEPMPTLRWIGFTLIWFALLLFSGDAILRAYGRREGTLHPS